MMPSDSDSDRPVSDTSADRPVPGPPVIGVEGEAAILRELLEVERARLLVAREIEVRRGIVFPETTVIVRDIERLLGKVRAREDAEAGAVPTRPAAALESELETLLLESGEAALDMLERGRSAGVMGMGVKGRPRHG